MGLQGHFRPCDEENNRIREEKVKTFMLRNELISYSCQIFSGPFEEFMLLQISTILRVDY